MFDFNAELSGYNNNANICKSLEKLTLQEGCDNIHVNMMLCYIKLIELGVIGREEKKILEAWLNDVTAQITMNNLA